MQKNNLNLLFYKKNKTQTLKDKMGKIIFVGNLKQIRKRVKILLGSRTTEALFQSMDRAGWSVSGPPQPVLKIDGKIYNAYMDTLKEKLKTIPNTPGVYQFKNKDGEVIYIGKAKNLKNRVSQYFGHHDKRPQLPYLMAEAADIEYTVVDNELESLFLENTLIKKHFPKYNIQIRDDKNYAFITIDYSCEIPAISYARKFDRDNKQIKYFGPYSAAYKIRNTLNLIRRIFPYCAATKIGDRPCFYYYLHRCPGVCIGKISILEYKQQLDRICWFLSGNTSKIKQELKSNMKIAATRQKFETAARLRDQLQALEILDERQNVIMNKPVSWDIFSLSTESGFVCINLFKIREGKMIGKENFVFEEIRSDKNEDQYTTSQRTSEILQTFLEKYYLETSDAPKIVFAQNLEDSELVEHIIRSRFGHKTEITIPQKGKAADLIKLGATNAEEYLKHSLTTQAEHLDRIQSALAQLKEALKLEKTPERIEGFDISNTQGTNPVGSMVVIKNGLPAKSEYRKFKIYSKKTPDDFAMMREMLGRRLERLNKKDPKFPPPDLLVIDGGKGQLGVAVEILKEKGVSIPVVGIAKRIEEIFFPGESEPLILPPNSPVLHMLQRLRDEAHRFGITFHRKLRIKQAIRSALDDIPGIGPKTKKLLKDKFGTVANIRKTSLQDLAGVVGERIAQAIQQSL
jgi:excinuclease ABC subunit C